MLLWHQSPPPRSFSQLVRSERPSFALHRDTHPIPSEACARLAPPPCTGTSTCQCVLACRACGTHPLAFVASVRNGLGGPARRHVRVAPAPPPQCRRTAAPAGAGRPPLRVGTRVHVPGQLKRAPSHPSRIARARPADTKLFTVLPRQSTCGVAAPHHRTHQAPEPPPSSQNTPHSMPDRAPPAPRTPPPQHLRCRLERVAQVVFDLA